MFKKIALFFLTSTAVSACVVVDNNNLQVDTDDNTTFTCTSQVPRCAAAFQCSPDGELVSVASQYQRSLRYLAVGGDLAVELADAVAEIPYRFLDSEDVAVSGQARWVEEGTYEYRVDGSTDVFVLLTLAYDDAWVEADLLDPSNYLAGWSVTANTDKSIYALHYDALGPLAYLLGLSEAGPHSRLFLAAEWQAFLQAFADRLAQITLTMEIAVDDRDGPYWITYRAWVADTELGSLLSETAMIDFEVAEVSVDDDNGSGPVVTVEDWDTTYENDGRGDGGSLAGDCRIEVEDEDVRYTSDISFVDGDAEVGYTCAGSQNDEDNHWDSHDDDDEDEEDDNDDEDNDEDDDNHDHGFKLIFYHHH